MLVYILGAFTFLLLAEILDVYKKKRIYLRKAICIERSVNSMKISFHNELNIVVDKISNEGFTDVVFLNLKKENQNESIKNKRIKLDLDSYSKTSQSNLLMKKSFYHIEFILIIKEIGYILFEKKIDSSINEIFKSKAHI